jgi:hypothetical protein
MQEFNKVGFENIEGKNFVIYALTLMERDQDDKKYGVGIETYAEPIEQDIFKLKGLQQEINNNLQPAKKFRDVKYYKTQLNCGKLLTVFLPRTEEQMSDELLNAISDLIELNLQPISS